MHSTQYSHYYMDDDKEADATGQEYMKEGWQGQSGHQSTFAPLSLSLSVQEFHTTLRVRIMTTINQLQDQDQEDYVHKRLPCIALSIYHVSLHRQKFNLKFHSHKFQCWMEPTLINLQLFLIGSHSFQTFSHQFPNQFRMLPKLRLILLS